MLPFARVAIIGMGLIGSSMARAIRVSMPTVRITASDGDGDVRARVLALDLADDVTDNAGAAVVDADLVILAVPVGAMGAVAAEIAGDLAPGAIVTDVGSVKGRVLADLTAALPGVAIVPGHPVAGTERSGPDAGFASLFTDRWCILTPRCARPRLRQGGGVLDAARRPRRSDGCQPSRPGAGRHQPSPPPHRLFDRRHRVRPRKRHPQRSHQIFSRRLSRFHPHRRQRPGDVARRLPHNREAVLETLGRFTEDLVALQRAIRWGEGETLEALFTRTRAIRRSIIDEGQDTETPDFGRPH